MKSLNENIPPFLKNKNADLQKLQQSTVGMILWIVSIIALISGTIMYFNGLSTYWSLYLLGGLCFAGGLINRAGHKKSSALILIGSILAIVQFNIYRGYGIHDVGIIAWPLVIFFCGLLFGSRVMPCITGLIMLLAVVTRFIPNAQHFTDKADTSDLMVMLLILAAFSLIGQIIIRRSETSVQRLSQSEEAVRSLNSELEQRVRERTIQLEAANRELEAFSYSVSHDLRTPLRAMNGFSGILLADYHDKLDGQGQVYLVHIQDASQRMGQLIDDLLNLSRVTRTEFTRQLVNLSAMAREITVELQMQDPQRQVIFEITDNLVVSGDAHLLKIVLENLLNNAFKYTNQRKETVIQVGVMEQNSQYIYFVRDNGAGFDMIYSNKLFAPFQRLHRIQDFPGTGIGLATVQRIISRHGGRVWAEAAVDQGATFYFTLGTV
jgi:signal transduction histidine kinase